MKYFNIFKIITNSFYNASIQIVRHDGIEHAGYMSFLSILSLFPFLVFLMAIAGFFGNYFIGDNFLQFFLHSLPYDISIALKPRITEILSGPPQNLRNLAVIGAIWTASSAVEGLRTILNRAYHVKNYPPYILRRMLSILQFIFLNALILAITFIFLILPILWERIPFLSETSKHIFNLLNLKNNLLVNFEFSRHIIVWFTLFVVICILYKILPNTQLKWYFIYPGALFVVIFWSLTGNFLSYYISKFNQINFIYGSLQNFILSLIFFYVINLIFIFGAEFNYQIGKHIKNYLDH